MTNQVGRPVAELSKYAADIIGEQLDAVGPRPVASAMPLKSTANTGRSSHSMLATASQSSAIAPVPPSSTTGGPLGLAHGQARSEIATPLTTTRTSLGTNSLSNTTAPRASPFALSRKGRRSAESQAAVDAATANEVGYRWTSQYSRCG